MTPDRFGGRELVLSLCQGRPNRTSLTVATRFLLHGQAPVHPSSGNPRATAAMIAPSSIGSHRPIFLQVFLSSIVEGIAFPLQAESMAMVASEVERRPRRSGNG